MLRLTSRLIGRHQLQLFQYYPYVLRYLNSHDKDKIGEIFAMIIESCHELVPPEEVKPIIERIEQNYITEYCSAQHITIGLNAVREILQRMPLALEKPQVEYLVEFRANKNKSVVAAAKSLINYFRDVCPQMLPKKHVGRFTDLEETKTPMVFGQTKMAYNIDGIELLKEGDAVATERMLDNEDLRKIKYRQLKKAVQKVDRKRFRDSSDESADSDNEEQSELEGIDS